MPEFELDHGSAEGAARFEALDEFTQGYVTCAFFTYVPEPDRWEFDPTFDDLHPDALRSVVADCRDFQDKFRVELDIASKERPGYSDNDAGRDFWLTRNHHGAGFWDRGPHEVWKVLTLDAQACGSRDLHKGDDGFVHID